MKKILVTGGAVHAHLDSVKLITNRFRGGLMAATSDKFNSFHDVDVHHLSSKVSVVPSSLPQEQLHQHTGFHNYMEKVLAMAPDFDAVVLGAAVCNLIPVKPFEGKFPSHNYKPGDVIPIDFTIAPRVIDEVKKVAPNTHLFGYKLLAGVDHEELVQAAYDIVLESRATCVFANDATDLNTKFAVTKEGAEHVVCFPKPAKFMMDMINDEYYKTELINNKLSRCQLAQAEIEIMKVIDRYQDKFIEKNGYVFGTVAIKTDRGFITTARGKNEIADITIVDYVDHGKRIVHSHDKKATLNAPLLARIFFANPSVNVIVHYHELNTGLPELVYAPPGTVRDSLRPVHRLIGDFEIKDHGVFRMFRDI